MLRARSLANPTSMTIQDYYDQGVAALKQKDYETAFKNFQAVIDLDYRHTLAYFNKALILQHWGQFSSAVDSLNWAIRLAPDRSDYYLARAYLYKKLHQPNDAAEDYQHVIRLSVDAPNVRTETYNSCGVLYYEQGKFSEAIDAYRQALKNDPHYSLSYFNLGIVYGEQGNRPEALKNFQLAWEQLDAFPDNKLYAGIQLQKLGFTQELALPALLTEISQNPRKIESLCIIVIAAYALKQVDIARTHAEKLLLLMKNVVNKEIPVYLHQPLFTILVNAKLWPKHDNDTIKSVIATAEAMHSAILPAEDEKNHLLPTMMKIKNNALRQTILWQSLLSNTLLGTVFNLTAEPTKTSLSNSCVKQTLVLCLHDEMQEHGFLTNDTTKTALSQDRYLLKELQQHALAASFQEVLIPETPNMGLQLGATTFQAVYPRQEEIRADLLSKADKARLQHYFPTNADL